MNRRFEISICLAALFLHLSVIFLGFATPLYTDELMTKNAVSRLSYDGGVLSGLLPQCEASFRGVRPPLMFLPFAEISSGAYDLFYAGVNSPLAVRLAGIIGYLLVLLPLLLIFRRLSPGWLGLTVCMAILSLGVLPWLLIINRPEQEIAAGVLWTIYLILRFKEPPKSIKANWISALGLVVVSGYLLFIHPKAAFFGLIFLLAVHYLLRLRYLKVIVMLFAVGFFASAILLNPPLKCPGFSDVEKKYQTQAELRTSSQEISAQFNKFLWSLDDQGKINLFGETGFARNYQEDWLPASPLSAEERLVNNAFQIISLLLFLVTLGLTLFNLFRGVRKRSLSRAQLLGAVLVFTLIIFRCIYFAQNFYEAALFAPFWLAAFALGAEGNLKSLKGRSWLAVAFTVVSIFSCTQLIRRFETYWPEWRHGGHLAQQPLSVGTLNSDQWRSEVLRAAQACGLEPEKQPGRVLVDDVSIFLYLKSDHPINYTYLYKWDPNELHPIEILKDRKSQGAIGSCELMKQIRGLELIQTGEYCCAKAF